MKSRFQNWALGVIALVGIAASPVIAQCPSSGCGSSSGSGCGASGSIAGSGGGARGCGCSGSSSTGTASRGAPPVIREEAKPLWQSVGSALLETAAAEKRPIVVYFADEANSEYAMIGEDLANLSKTSAVFVKIPHNPDRSTPDWVEESAVPSNKLLSDNPARDFNIRSGSVEVLLLDWYGNEHKRFGDSAKADLLKKHIELIAKQVEKVNEDLEKGFTKAQEAHNNSDRKTALKYILKNFKDGQVGLPAQEETIRLYRSIMDSARTEMESMVAEKDAEGLKRLSRELRKTDVQKSIDEAISELG